MYACKTLIRSANEFASREKRLSICLGADGFSFAETTTSGVLGERNATRTLLSFGEAEGRHASSMTGVMADVKAFFAEAGIRPLGYKAMELIVLSDESTWVPDELYSSISNRSYLRLVGSTPDTVMTCHSQALASTAVFAANEQVVTAFKVAMPGVAVMHQHAKMAQLAPACTAYPVLLTFWRQGRVDVAAFHDGRYIYGNTLRFSNDNEAIYHLVEVMKTYGLEDDATTLLLSGDVDRQRYALLRPYFPQVTLFNGNVNRDQSAELHSLHAYRHALIMM